MSQSSLLVGLLAAAFLLYVAAKGRLPTYTGVLWGKAPDKGDKGGKDSGMSEEDAAKLALKYLPYVLA